MKSVLSHLSNASILKNVQNLVIAEKKTTTEVILHLAEIESRRLYAELGYSSLYNYSTKALGYSNSAAMRRIKVARCVAMFAGVGTMLKNGELSIGSIAVFCDVLDFENERGLLAEVKGKSKSEVERLVASYRPVESKRLRDRVVPVVLAPEKDSSNSGENEAQLGLLENLPTNSQRVRCGRTGGLGGECEDEERLLRVSFTANEDFMDKVARAKGLMLKKLGPGAQLEDVFEKALDEFIEAHCPRARQRRRNKRKQTQKNTKSKVSPQQAKHALAELARDVQKNIAEQTKRTRYIPVAMRDQVLERDGHRCTFIGVGGRRCEQKYGLEVHHVVPFAKGGGTTLENLSCRCKAHNLLEAERDFGGEYMQQFRRRSSEGVNRV